MRGRPNPCYGHSASYFEVLSSNSTYLVWISVDFEMNHFTTSSRQRRILSFCSYNSVLIHDNRDTLTAVAISIILYRPSIRKPCPLDLVRQPLIPSSNKTQLDITLQISFTCHYNSYIYTTAIFNTKMLPIKAKPSRSSDSTSY